MATTSIPPSVIYTGKEYQTSDWGKQISDSDVWEGPVDELRALQSDIKRQYTTTGISRTKGGHGRLIATITTDPADDNPGPPAGDTSIEVEWVELRLPVESNPKYKDLSAVNKAIIRKGAMEGKTWAELPPMAGDVAVGETLHAKIAAGTTEWSTGVPVVRRTTKNASNIEKGKAWFRDNPPVTVPKDGEGEWEWLKTTDRRVKIGSDITQVEEWTGSEEWDHDHYPIAG